MSRDFKTIGLRLAALGAAACSSAYAVRSNPGQDGALVATTQPLARSPYDVELIGEGGRALESYERGGRFYVLGQSGERYSIRVSNPTQRRVEALISVDGLDVIDGEDADFASKRGYIVPAGGDLVIDGFRMSATQVASFRFSAVGASYAERKGKGRNVGVIGVAIFEEKEQPQIVQPEIAQGDPQAPPRPSPGWSGDEGSMRDSESVTAGPAPSRSSKPTTSAPPADGRAGGFGGGVAKGEAAPAEEAPARRMDSDDKSATETRKSRPGLGTEWGEERYSAVDFTQFERANQTTPSALAELRYNDAEGLRALGVLVEPTPDEDELDQRETADPFPAARGFAAPPQ
jgi:hypothetical protein